MDFLRESINFLTLFRIRHFSSHRCAFCHVTESSVMLGTGMTLERSDFTNIVSSRTRRSSVPVGVLCQFILMPLAACIIGRTLLLPYRDATGQHLGKHLFLGLVLVGCSPGGTASNLVTLIAGADVALSVLLTACSTVLASAVTPLLTKLIVGNAAPVSGMALCAACAKVVLAPVALGVTLNEYAPRLCKWVSDAFVSFLVRTISIDMKNLTRGCSRFRGGRPSRACCWCL